MQKGLSKKLTDAAENLLQWAIGQFISRIHDEIIASH